MSSLDAVLAQYEKNQQSGGGNFGKINGKNFTTQGRTTMSVLL